MRERSDLIADRARLRRLARDGRRGGAGKRGHSTRQVRVRLRLDVKLKRVMLMMVGLFLGTGCTEILRAAAAQPRPQHGAP